MRFFYLKNPTVRCDADFVSGELYGAVRCGACFGLWESSCAVRCGFVKKRKIIRKVRCVSVKHVKKKKTHRTRTVANYLILKTI